MINENLLRIIKDYQNLPNVPFIQKHTISFVKKFLEEHSINYLENDYSIIIRSNNDISKRKLVLLAHLDHPGIIFKNNKIGKIFGFGNISNLRTYLLNNKLSIKVYSSQGIDLGIVNIVGLNPGFKHEVVVDSSIDIPINSIGYFDIVPFQSTKDTLQLYNADDGVMVSILLYCLSNNIFGTQYNIDVVFLKHEEVHQLSSWWLSSNNIFGLTSNDLILNLEALKLDIIKDISQESLDYSKGLVLQLSNKGCLFGYKNEGPNMLELYLRKISYDRKIPLQVGMLNDSCDSRTFSYFGITPNICTLTIPNKYKHNGLDDGLHPQPEIIRVTDVIDCIEILKNLTTQEVSLDSNLDSISQKFKKQDTITDLGLMNRKALLNKRLAIAYKAIIRRGYFYPQNFLDLFYDLFFKLLSYFVYFIVRIIR